MAIISTDIQYRLSGGASNAVTASSLGGVKSSVAASNYFDDVSSAEAGTGDTEYRCIHHRNSCWLRYSTSRRRVTRQDRYWTNRPRVGIECRLK